MRLYSLLIFLCLLIPSFGQKDQTFKEEQVYVHILGEVNKPGEYKINEVYNEANLAKVCGGITTFGNIKETYIIRFKRQEGHCRVVLPN